MTIDMEQFHQVFFEESQEHLEEMEHELMALDLATPDFEQLNTIFRAAHSIKGGSGIFGFDALTGLTHVMENLLDRARKSTITLTTPVVDTLLTTVDILKEVLDCYRHEAPINWSAIEQGTERLETLLKQSYSDSPSPTESNQDEQGYGLFPQPVLNEQPAYGLWDEAETDNATSNNDDDDGFGFFEPVSPEAKPIEKEAGPQKSDKGKVIPKVAASRKPSNQESSTIRVDTQKIDALVNLVGQLVITQSMLMMTSENNDAKSIEHRQSALSELERSTREIQEAVMSMRMLPMSFVFNRFPRLVRDLSAKLDKKLELVIEGANTEIDKGVIEKLVDPLTHLVRNSIDHGIEMPDDRIAKGKAETGKLVLRASHKGGNIVISIMDDGAGLNRQKILDKAHENNVLVPEAPSDSQVWNLIFAAGFSTAEQVTDVSGRGVGMDVVKRNIEKLGGRVEIESEQGAGTAIHIRLPLTLAIVDGMSVAVGEQIFIVPLVNIIESIQPSKAQIKSMGDEKLLWVREEYWPLIKLYQIMDVPGAEQDLTQSIVVLIESANKRFGLVVDTLIGQQQVVIKSLEQHYKRIAGVAGATIMGDGNVALILDAESLAEQIVELEPISE